MHKNEMSKNDSTFALWQLNVDLPFELSLIVKRFWKFDYTHLFWWKNCRLASEIYTIRAK